MLDTVCVCQPNWAWKARYRRERGVEVLCSPLPTFGLSEQAVIFFNVSLQIDMKTFLLTLSGCWHPCQAQWALMQNRPEGVGVCVFSLLRPRKRGTQTRNYILFPSPLLFSYIPSIPFRAARRHNISILRRKMLSGRYWAWTGKTQPF